MNMPEKNALNYISPILVFWFTSKVLFEAIASLFFFYFLAVPSVATRNV